MNESVAHIRNEPRQPKFNSFVNGTLIPADNAAPIAIVLEYRLVTIPELAGKFCFVSVGSNTFPKAMATPKSSVPI